MQPKPDEVVAVGVAFGTGVGNNPPNDGRTPVDPEGE